MFYSRIEINFVDFGLFYKDLVLFSDPFFIAVVVGMLASALFGIGFPDPEDPKKKVVEAVKEQIDSLNQALDNIQQNINENEQTIQQNTEIINDNSFIADQFTKYVNKLLLLQSLIVSFILAPTVIVLRKIVADPMLVQWLEMRKIFPGMVNQHLASVLNMFVHQSAAFIDVFVNGSRQLAMETIEYVNECITDVIKVFQPKINASNDVLIDLHKSTADLQNQNGVLSIEADRVNIELEAAKQKLAAEEAAASKFFTIRTAYVGLAVVSVTVISFSVYVVCKVVIGV